MYSDQVVIYICNELREAYLLRDVLAAEGISAAVVSQEMSARLGLAVKAAQPEVRVVVSQADAMRARQLAVRFQGRRAAELQPATWQTGASHSDDRPASAVGPASSWPRCPECNLPRSTRCPICGTAGSDFPPADLPEELPADCLTGGGGSPSCCPSIVCGGQPAAGSGSPSDTGEASGSCGEQFAPECICPTCDEPFRPVYHRRCQWCDYEFPDGEDYPLPAADSGMSVAAITAVVVLAVILLGLSAYFLMLF